jgi:hypothetical protein
MTDWTAATADLRCSSREGDRVLIDAPEHSMAREFQGQEGRIAEFWEQWVIVRLDGTGDSVRLRPDEVRAL